MSNKQLSPDNLTPDDLNNLIKWIRTQEDANRLEVSRQNIEKRRENLLLELASTNQQISQEARQLILEIRQLIASMRQFMANQELRDEATRELGEVISNRMVTLERGIMLTLMEDLDNPQLQYVTQQVVDELATNISKESMDSKKRQLMIEVGNLAKYEEERAELGAQLDVALENKITRTKSRIVKLEDEVRGK